MRKLQLQSQTFPPEPSSGRAARAFVSEVARDRQVDLDALMLMTSELVSNVLRHTDSPVTVKAGVGPPFRVEVHDGAAATEAFRKMIAERPQLTAADVVGGRGIRLVHDLASRIGLEEDGDGKAVWFEL
jgi:anti-sigma regulatory factor (Ser/Thr protein kinase)